VHQEEAKMHQGSVMRSGSQDMFGVYRRSLGRTVWKTIWFMLNKSSGVKKRTEEKRAGGSNKEVTHEDFNF
jgi:hypothetical protein